jgi:glutathione reductase (NADPH)
MFHAAGDSASIPPGDAAYTGSSFRSQGRRIQHAETDTAITDYTAIPTVVFTILNSSASARTSMMPNSARYRRALHRFSGRYLNHRIGETAGATKTLIDKNTDLIIGAHLFATTHAEVANTISSQKHGLTTKQINRRPPLTLQPDQTWRRCSIFSDALREQ